MGTEGTGNVRRPGKLEMVTTICGLFTNKLLKEDDEQAREARNGNNNLWSIHKQGLAVL